MLIEDDPSAEPGEDLLILNFIDELKNLNFEGNPIVSVNTEISPRVLNRLFNTAIINGLGEIVEKLSKIADIYKNIDFKEAIDAAAQNGKLEIIKFLYAVLPNDFAPDGSSALCLAAQKGYLDIVKFLVTVQNVDPSAQQNAAIRSAYEQKQQEVVEFLSTQPCYNPFDKGITLKSKNYLIKLLTYLGVTKQLNSHLAQSNFRLGFLFFGGSAMDCFPKEVRTKITLTALKLDYSLISPTL
ncbi:MAG: ankyrin repeat domain-containing protein [Tatlockia sp.]|nr:ankyrin repeat domain-containing protein [Tatlockia sp.]